MATPNPQVSATRTGRVVAAPPSSAEWFKALMLDEGYLAQLKGDAVKVYLAMLKLGGGRLNSDFATTHKALMKWSCVTEPTLCGAIKQLNQLGLITTIREQPGVGSIYRCGRPDAKRKERPQERLDSET